MHKLTLFLALILTLTPMIIGGIISTLLMKAPEYTIIKNRFGTYTSVTTDGEKLVTGLTEDAVRYCTDMIHIPVMLGTFDGTTSKPRSSVVQGKL